MVYMTTTLIPHQPGSNSCLKFYNSAKNMAIDTSKDFEGSKPFSFTQSNNNKSPLILEIIFSLDDSSATNIGNKDTEEEEVGDDVESNDGDVDESVSSSDEEECEESEEEDAEDSDDEEEESEDEDCEDNGDNDDDDGDDGTKDFGRGFDDDDLIVDFSNDNDEELQVEFDDPSDSDNPPLSPHTKVNPTPFWFTNEEPDQIRMIFDSYSVTLNIEEQRNACIRSPAPFVGRIIRMPITPAANETDKRFKTLDKVEVYLREVYPLGIILPLSRVAWLITTWDEEEGVPISSTELTKSSKKSAQKRALANQTSTLFCAPIFCTKDSYQYSVSSASSSSSLPSPSLFSSSRSSHLSSAVRSSPSLRSSSSLSSPSFPPSSSYIPSPIMYASSSATNTSISQISPFLPEKCRVTSFFMD